MLGLVLGRVTRTILVHIGRSPLESGMGLKTLTFKWICARALRVHMELSKLAQMQYRFRIEIANIPCRVPCMNIRHQNVGHNSRATSLYSQLGVLLNISCALFKHPHAQSVNCHILAYQWRRACAFRILCGPKPQSNANHHEA